MSETNDSELGRSKNSATPAEHLRHLLNLGWDPMSPLILKYVSENSLHRDVADWQSLNPVVLKPAVVAAKGKSKGK